MPHMILRINTTNCPLHYIVHIHCDLRTHCLILLLQTCTSKKGGPGSSVGIATDYGLDGPGSNPGEDEVFRRPDRPWGPPSLLYNGYRVFPGGKVRPGRTADH